MERTAIFGSRFVAYVFVSANDLEIKNHKKIWKNMNKKTYDTLLYFISMLAFAIGEFLFGGLFLLIVNSISDIEYMTPSFSTGAVIGLIVSIIVSIIATRKLLKNIFFEV